MGAITILIIEEWDQERAWCSDFKVTWIGYMITIHLFESLHLRITFLQNVFPNICRCPLWEYIQKIGLEPPSFSGRILLQSILVYSKTT